MTDTHRQDAAAPKTAYCAGFLFDDTGRVVLIAKSRPTWQAGLLNGVGGHVEHGETPGQAMSREFREEVGLDVGGWEHFATQQFAAGAVWWHRLSVDAATLDLLDLRDRGEGDIVIRSVAEVAVMAHDRLMAGLPVLLPLAVYRGRKYAPVLLVEK